LRLTEKTPLVGLHGMVDSEGIVSLGAILVDTISPICQISSFKVDQSMYQGLSETE